MAPPSANSEATFSVAATLGIAIALFVPFVARSLSGALEPYPAVLLPAGAGWIESRAKELRFDQLKLWGRCRGERASWSELDSERVMAPIPVYYLGAIEERGFGLGAPARQRINVKLIGDVDVPRPEPSLEDVAATKRWLGTRLQELGCSPKELRVTRQVKVVEVPSGRVSPGPLSQPEVILALD
jgi:hypothetical protein